MPRSDLLKRAVVDQYLDWNNTSARPHLVDATLKIVNGPAMGLPKPSEEEAKALMDEVYRATSDINTLVSENGGFLTGDKMTIADIQIYNIYSLVKIMLQLDTSKYESFEKWMTAISEDETIKELDAGMLKRLQEAAAASS